MIGINGQGPCHTARHAEGMGERGSSMKWPKKLGWKRTEIAFGAVWLRPNCRGTEMWASIVFACLLESGVQLLPYLSSSQEDVTDGNLDFVFLLCGSSVCTIWEECVLFSKPACLSPSCYVIMGMCICICLWVWRRRSVNLLSWLQQIPKVGSYP